MSLDSLFGRQQLPQAEAAPRRGDQSVQEARRRARRLSSLSGRRGTVLGGTTGGGETIARKTLLGE